MPPTPTRRLTVLLAAALVAAACSSSGDSSAPEEAQASASPEAGSEQEDASTRSGKKGDRRKGNVFGRPADGGERGQGEGRGGPAGSGGRGGPGGQSSGVAYPDAGTYVYAQKGYEEVCSAGCERDPLPPTQEIDASYSERTSAGAIVVTDARASGDRLVRTTTVYTAAEAAVTEVYIEYTFGTVKFSTTYHPDPPPEVLRLPLATGMEWSGEWKARTSGDYSVTVAGRDPISAGGDSVNAFRLDTVTHFRGEFDGRAVVTVWVDPATNLVVASDGEMHLSTQFGRYNTAFETTLDDGPGY